MSQDLVDIDVFQEAKKVIEALQNKEVGPALAWCAENKSRLKKSKVCISFWGCMLVGGESLLLIGGLDKFVCKIICSVACFELANEYPVYKLKLAILSLHLSCLLVYLKLGLL